MSNEQYGFDTKVKCPKCKQCLLRVSTKGMRGCPRCGHTERNDPVTTTTTKDHTHG